MVWLTRARKRLRKGAQSIRRSMPLKYRREPPGKFRLGKGPGLATEPEAPASGSPQRVAHGDPVNGGGRGTRKISGDRAPGIWLRRSLVATATRAGSTKGDCAIRATRAALPASPCRRVSGAAPSSPGQQAQTAQSQKRKRGRLGRGGGIRREGARAVRHVIRWRGKRPEVGLSKGIGRRRAKGIGKITVERHAQFAVRRLVELGSVITRGAGAERDRARCLAIHADSWIRAEVPPDVIIAVGAMAGIVAHRDDALRLPVHVVDVHNPPACRGRWTRHRETKWRPLARQHPGSRGAWRT